MCLVLQGKVHTHEESAEKSKVKRGDTKVIC